MRFRKITSIVISLSLVFSGLSVKASENMPVAEVDFSALTTGFEYGKAYTSEEMMKIYNNDIKSYGSGGIHKLVKDEHYGTSLQIYPAAKNTGGNVIMQLSETITSGRLEVDINLKTLGTANLIRHILLPIDSSGSNKFTFE